MKSYGRAPTFLALTGYEQVRSIAAAIAGDREAAERVELVLPETGVCSGGGLLETAVDAATADDDRRRGGRCAGDGRWMLRAAAHGGPRDTDHRAARPLTGLHVTHAAGVAATPGTLSEFGLRRVLVVLCVTEIVSWGVLYYAFPVLAPSIARDTGWSVATITAAFSTRARGLSIGRSLVRSPPRPDRAPPCDDGGVGAGGSGSPRHRGRAVAADVLRRVGASRSRRWPALSTRPHLPR